MYYLTLLDQSICAAINSRSIGSPVFVRWTASIAKTKETLTLQLAEMAAYVGRWHGLTLQRLYATGSAEQGHLSLSLEYIGGSSGLVALTLAHNQPHMNLAIYGHEGALYHNDFIIPTRDGSLESQLHSKEMDVEFQKEVGIIAVVIQESLAAHQPIELA